MTKLDIKALSLSSKASICWGFFWRGMVVTLGSLVCSALLAGVIGAICAVFGFSASVTSALGSLVGALSGAVFLYFYVRWLLSARLGRFRLVLVHAQEQAPDMTSAVQPPSAPSGD